MSKTIPLTQGKVAIVDDADYEWLSQWKWFAQHTHHIWYAARKLRGKTMLMHRVILGADSGQQGEHRDRNGLNNRRANLRLCTRSQNAMNSKKRADCTSKYKGVSWRKTRQKWQVHIGFNGEHYCLGLFDDEVKAAKAYNKAAKAYFGEFARLNEIEEKGK